MSHRLTFNDTKTELLIIGSKHLTPVARSLVSANRWLRGIRTYGFPWYLTPVSANHASSNRTQLSKVSIDSIRVGHSQIKPSEAVRNLGSWFDSHMNMNVQVGKICSKAFYGVYNIRRFLACAGQLW